MSTTYQSDYTVLASYKGRNARQNRTVTGDNLRACDPSPYDIITGRKTEEIDPEVIAKNIGKAAPPAQGCNDYAVNVPISVSGLGCSEPRSIVIGEHGNTSMSYKVLRSNRVQHIRNKMENRDRFEYPATSNQVVGFFPTNPKPPMFGRKKCQETTIEEHMIMGPHMP
eukprot:CAMPEP_0118933796 /NCGR_PEP_ID=MMETSP1169-20130426/12505_1 /TAXON_ID=36882 /ORGANISM="Pyramimonas obovata, Strain CCMP722" /LENGTH=167 /DNA_ID=CAMNT_0006876605 /DNA_START=265 /DNA_END=768 /DNA_ORIENTATION=+